MQTTILSFGRIAAITGNATFTLEGATDTNGLRKVLHERYSELVNMKYAIAVNKEIVTGNAAIPDGAVIALLPPFSGG